MYCTNGHPASYDAQFCATCGIDTFTHDVPASASAAAIFVPARVETVYLVHEKQPMNGFAIASMVLSIVWLYGVGSIMGIIFGVIARRQIKERDETGDAFAVTGIAVGCAGLVGVVLYFVFLDWFLHIFLHAFQTSNSGA